MQFLAPLQVHKNVYFNFGNIRIKPRVMLLPGLSATTFALFLYS